MAAMLEHDAGGVARLVGRREGDEQRVVAHLTAARRCSRTPLAALGHGDAADLGGAGLAGDRDAVDVAASPTPPVPPPLTTPHIASRTKARCSGVERQADRRASRARSAAGAARAIAARCDPRRHHRELERVDQHIALADRRVERVARRSIPGVSALLPGGVGDGAVALRRNRQVELLAEPQRARHRRDASMPTRRAIS